MSIVKSLLALNSRSLITGVLLLCAHVLVSPSNGAECKTSVSGIVDGETWTTNGSPYCIVGDVQVSSLKIEPGVEVQLSGDYKFDVTGRLQAAGTSSNHIHFSAVTTNVGWQGISFVDTRSGSYLNFCTIENAHNSGIRISSSAATGGNGPALTNCTLLNNTSADRGGGIYAIMQSGDLLLVNCTFQRNIARYGGGGVYGKFATGTLRMINCIVQSNIVNVAGNSGGSPGGGGVRIVGGGAILNTTISDNLVNGYALFNVDCGEAYGGGLMLDDNGHVVIRNCKFERNVAQVAGGGTGCATADGGGIYVRGPATILNSIVASNACIAADFARGAGIMATANLYPANVINCSIIGNNRSGVFNSRCRNSIIYFNNGNAAQIDGGTTVSYCDIQGGAEGVGNISVHPNLRPGTFDLLSLSPCIDTGDPDPAYNDSCFPPTESERNDMGAYGGPAACCWTSPCDAPAITAQPKGIITCTNSTASFCVSAFGDEPLRYQWYFFGASPTNQPVSMPNGTNACLTLNNLTLDDAGYYAVSVSNDYGSLSSALAQLQVAAVCTDLQLYAGVTISGGTPGQSYKVQVVPNITDTNWTTLTTITQAVSGFLWYDPQPVTYSTRFYRVVPQ